MIENKTSTEIRENTIYMNEHAQNNKRSSGLHYKIISLIFILILFKSYYDFIFVYKYIIIR